MEPRMISRMTIPAGILAAAICALVAIPPGVAQAAGGNAPADDTLGLRGVGNPAEAVKKPAVPHKTKTVREKPAAQQKPADKPKAMEPWAAVDPARAGLVDEKAAAMAPMPGVAHPAPSDEGSVSTGVKWNSSNSPNYGPMSTSGLMNGYNSAVSGSPDQGTTVEPGVKFKF
jgi:hypothetical protein